MFIVLQRDNGETRLEAFEKTNGSYFSRNF